MLTNLILAALVILSPARTDDVDLIEVNHVYDGNGKRTFEQLIFWNRDGHRLQVVAWRAIGLAERPRRDFQRGGAVSIFLDSGKLRRVTSRHKFSSWTNYDPEFVERTILPVSKRRGLRK